MYFGVRVLSEDFLLLMIQSSSCDLSFLECIEKMDDSEAVVEEDANRLLSIFR